MCVLHKIWAGTSKEENKKEKNILKEINNMATEEYSKEKIEELSKELEWKYKYKDSTVLPTKTSVSRLKEESQEILKNKIEEKNLEILNRTIMQLKIKRGKTN